MRQFVSEYNLYEIHQVKSVVNYANKGITKTLLLHSNLCVLYCLSPDHFHLQHSIPNPIAQLACIHAGLMHQLKHALCV